MFLTKEAHQKGFTGRFSFSEQLLCQHQQVTAACGKLCSRNLWWKFVLQILWTCGNFEYSLNIAMNVFCTLNEVGIWYFDTLKICFITDTWKVSSKTLSNTSFLRIITLLFFNNIEKVFYLFIFDVSLKILHMNLLCLWCFLVSRWYKI